MSRRKPQPPSESSRWFSGSDSNLNRLLEGRPLQEQAERAVNLSNVGRFDMRPVTIQTPEEQALDRIIATLNRQVAELRYLVSRSCSTDLRARAALLLDSLEAIDDLS